MVYYRVGYVSQLDQIWGFVLLCVYHSFVFFIYSDCVCGGVVTCSVGAPLFSVEYDQCSLHCIVCCVSSMFCANLEFDFLSIITWMCSLKRILMGTPYIIS